MQARYETLDPIYQVDRWWCRNRYSMSCGCMWNHPRPEYGTLRFPADAEPNTTNTAGYWSWSDYFGHCS